MSDHIHSDDRGGGGRLPDRMSAVVRLAADDFEAVQGDAGYEVRWHFWHRPRPDGPCQVNLAGAVMARTLGVDREEPAEPGDFPRHDRIRLERLESIRTGGWRKALVRADGKRWDALGGAGLARLESEFLVAKRGRTDIRHADDLRAVADVLERHGF